MSTRRSRKTANPRAKAPEPIITRTKSRQLRNKEDKKTEKPELTKPELTKPELTKPETKSTKVVKTVKRSQESLLKVPIVVVPDDDVQVEYYPNTLKRDVCAKKVMLKPKHNFKVIAATNKRKLATPQKGAKPPSNQSPQNSKQPGRSQASAATCPELSMQDMVRMMDETTSLSDEDFMEILTCPSPVWWEDPPDGEFDEDPIYTRSPEPPPATVANQNKKRKITTNTASSDSNNSRIKIIENNTDLSKEQFKTKDEKFVKKKQKLENVLGNIKNKTIQTKDDVKNDSNNRNRMLSESEDFSDLSFNEEEILKNLEEMEIPMEQSPSESNHSSDVKSETGDVEVKEQSDEIKNNELVSKNDNVDREILSIQIKEEIKEEFLIRSPVFGKESIFTGSEFNSSEDNISIKKSDEVVSIDSCSNSSFSNPDDSMDIVALDSNSNSDIGTKSLKDNSSNEIVPNKKTKDLSEFITVYKITPDKLRNENDSEKLKLPENTKTTKIETVRGKLNDFFKHRKSKIRLKKIENSIPAIPLTDVKETTDNETKDGDSKIDLEHEKNRLKSCDYCVEKTEKGTTDFSCEKCEMAPILPCGLCNFVADTKEVYKNHVSSCKDVARISWNHNYLLNQT